MKGASTCKKWLVYLQLLLLIGLAMPGNTLLLADTFTDRRVHVGLKLFRTLVSADLNIDKKANKDNLIPITIIYSNTKKEAQEAASTLSTSFPKVNDMSIDYRLMTVDQMIEESNKEENNKPAAIFLAQALNESDLKQVIDYGIENQTIVFSPFEGDVQQGVLGGLSVQATVRPLINQKTLQQSNLSIKPFYLKVAKSYE